MIGVVDYGLGNINAFLTLYRHAGVDAVAVSDAECLLNVDKIILPGVGAFDWAMDRLDASGMRPTLDCMVTERGIPVIGVCVGMQMMGRSSEEGQRRGLGWLPATVARFDLGEVRHLPHMGWNDVAPQNDSVLFRDLVDPRFYFLHSYYMAPEDPKLVIATAHYGNPFACAVQFGSIYATQFHPEKSHDWGARLLLNFAEYA